MRNRQFDLPPLAQLEAFEAAARHLSFTRAADELALTQSAVSRQIAALESFFGVPLFQRLHRALRLSDAGQVLQRAVLEVLQQLHEVSGALRGPTRLKTVVVTTTAGFAGLWLIPRLAGFTESRPDVDVRISASNTVMNLNRDGIDVAIRYDTEEGAGTQGVRLFGEVVLPVCSPRLLRDARRALKAPQDLRHHCMLHMDTGPGSQLLEWPMWLRAMKIDALKPASVLALLDVRPDDPGRRERPGRGLGPFASAEQPVGAAQAGRTLQEERGVTAQLLRVSLRCVARQAGGEPVPGVAAGRGFDGVLSPVR